MWWWIGVVYLLLQVMWCPEVARAGFEHTIEDVVWYKVGYDEAYEDCVGDLRVVGQESSGLIWVGKYECLRTFISDSISSPHNEHMWCSRCSCVVFSWLSAPRGPRSGTYSEVDEDALPLRPYIIDLLALAELSTEQDRTHAGYPTTLFMALKAVFNGIVTSSAQRCTRDVPPLPSLTDGVKIVVVNAFPTRRQRLQEERDRCRRAIYGRPGVDPRIWERRFALIDTAIQSDLECTGTALAPRRASLRSDRS
ncbi:hypothetical protein B0H17DRAFT_1137213 [Mycena rosella]|uniref:Uncharacterized protein n=1 Tax=Mycena rosella TaxID=1033263 RepID=A0AAD7D988_MYCRO|nr:hypothetical protein B0H17DRAFT_1137213 [Mycena rosella]